MYPPANQIHCFQIMAVNGEIYNHKELIAETPDFVPRTGSDCEALIGLYEKGENMRFSSKLELTAGIFFSHFRKNSRRKKPKFFGLQPKT